MSNCYDVIIIGGGIIGCATAYYLSGSGISVAVLEGSDRCSIRKRLTALPDGKLIVQESIDVEFVVHKSN